MKAALSKLSICPCGFPLLSESIPLGQEYELVPDDTLPVTLICGGCGNHIRTTGVFVKSRNGGRAGYLPREAFTEIAEAMQ